MRHPFSPQDVLPRDILIEYFNDGNLFYYDQLYISTLGQRRRLQKKNHIPLWEGYSSFLTSSPNVVRTRPSPLPIDPSTASFPTATHLQCVDPVLMIDKST